MNESISVGAIDSLYELFVLGICLIVFWILESVWRNNKYGLIFIIIFPPTLIYFIIKYWDETRGKCFFAAMLFMMILLISAVTDYNYCARIWHLIQSISFWAYYGFLRLHAHT